MSLHHVILILLLAPICLGSHFRGGIITWTPTEHDRQIEVSYRVSWRRSYSSNHFCDDSTISSGLLNNGEGSLQCAGGCTVTFVQMDYYCTDFSSSEDWTTGTRLLIYNLTATSTQINFTYTSCCWIGLQTNGNGAWAVKAIASVIKRNDTGKINSSPTTSVPPIVRVPQGCSATINLLVADQDGDIVRCRWSNTSDECGGICLSLPGAVLNEKTCTISYQANGTVGYYGVAVHVEDFASMGGTVPYSSVPVQFLVYVYSTNLGCYSLPEFISPTRGDLEVVYITVNNVYFDRIVAISKVPNTSIVEITTVSPSGFIKSALAEYTDVPGSWYVNITWTPTTSDVNKLYILCFTATDKMGLTSQQRCINLIVSPDVAINGSNRIQFDFGLTNDDSFVGVNDGKCKLVSKEYEFPVFRSTHSKIFVCINGIITFDEPFESPGTVDVSDLKGRTILAPYFNDIDRNSLRHGGNVYYQVYNSLKGDINESSNVRTAQNVIQQTLGDGNFIAQFALFVTWHQVRPTRTKTGQNERMNFQLALVTDGVNTFAFYVYPKNGIKLQNQQVFIGFTTKDGEKYVDYRSFTSAALAIDELAISFGYNGLLHYRLSFPSLGPKSSRQDCIDWYLNERKYRDEYQEGLAKMPFCPCDTSHLTRDQFYSSGDYFDQGDAFCTYIRPNWQFRPKDSGKTCCYDKANRYFVGYGSNAGGFIRYHPSKQALQHNSYDKDMRKACCGENNLCSLYHSVRPIGHCYKIFPAWHAPARGDPHFKTLDGQNYTFNGWGEFTLVTINSSAEEFELQSRTSRVVTKDGNMSDATAFTAFAARDTNNVQVHIELNAAKNGLIVYAKMAPSLTLSDYTADFTNKDKDFNFESDYMSLSRPNQTKNIMAVFASGVAFTVGCSVNMLNIDVLIPNKFQNMTAGLLGNFDGDPTNDIQFKNGTILWGIVGEKYIFNFGKSWAVDPDHSAFWYPRGKGYYDYNHLNYTPIFLEDIDTAKVASARDVCGVEEYECIFDLVLTEDEEVANETKRLGYAARQVDALLENEVPSISGPSTINVTINKTTTYQLSAFDDGEYSYQLLDGQLYANITDQKNGTADVNLLLQEDRPINVKATVVDKFGAQAAPHQVVIVVCSTCNQRGTCDFAEFRDDNRSTDSFKYAICRCDPYWDGPDCDMDRDGCSTQPCSPLRECTDIPADRHQATGIGYNCTDCPHGFTNINDGGCEDIDECSSSNGGCAQICSNTFGTFVCSCFEGYRKQTGICQDIDECLEASNDCDQICSNTVGGYNCSCYDGFVYNNVTLKCDEGVLPSGCNSLNCSGTAGCTTDNHGNATCFCPKGYNLSSDGESCDDINECQLSICQHLCTNTNGSFYCSCFNGYSMQSDRSSCKECELSKYGENCNNTCKCGQGAIRCDHIKGCICSDGWTGTNCDEDLDECQVPNICNDSLKICLNTKGSYACNCRDGYVLNTNGSCTDLNECTDPGLNTCQQVCQNEVGGFSCSCFNGYVQSRNNTRVCEDIDECAVGQSGCEQLCHNSEGRFTCDCHFGYILNSDRKTCTNVTDVCATYGNMNCSQICVLEEKQVFCSCVTGYKLSFDNQTCEDINECEDQQLNRCSHNCTNTNFGYVCSCGNGFQLDNDGRTCKACDAFHYGPKCSYLCNCGVGAERCDPITGCVCSVGWHGNKCDQDVNECAQNPCADNNSFCINTAGSYACNCLLGYRNVSGACQDIDECNDPRLNDCTHICLNIIGNYSCSCHEGYVSNGNACIESSPITTSSTTPITDSTMIPITSPLMTEASTTSVTINGGTRMTSESTSSEVISSTATAIAENLTTSSEMSPSPSTPSSLMSYTSTSLRTQGIASDITTSSEGTNLQTITTMTPTASETSISLLPATSSPSFMSSNSPTSTPTPTSRATTTPSSTGLVTTVTTSNSASTGGTTATFESTTAQNTIPTVVNTSEITTSVMTGSSSSMSSISQTSTFIPTAGNTNSLSISSSLTAMNITITTSSVGTTETSERSFTQSTTPASTVASEIAPTSILTSTFATSSNSVSALTSTIGATTSTPSSSSSGIAVNTSQTTSSSGTTATLESTTAQKTILTVTNTSEMTTSVMTGSPSSISSVSPTSTLTPTEGTTTTISISSSVTSVDTSNINSSIETNVTLESTAAHSTTPAITVSSEITPTSILTPTFTTSLHSISALTSPTGATTTTPNSSSSRATVDTSKTTSSSGTTATSKSTAAQSTTPAVTVTSEIATTSILTPPFSTSINSTSVMTETPGSTTSTPSSSSSETTVNTSKATSSSGTTATFESTTAHKATTNVTNTSEMKTSVMSGSPSISSVSPTSTLTPSAGTTTTVSISSSVDTSNITSSIKTNVTSESKAAQSTTPAVIVTSEITPTSISTPTFATSNNSVSALTSTTGATSTPSSSSSGTTVNTSQTTSSSGTTTTFQSTTAQKTIPTVTNTSKMTTSVMTGSRSATTIVNPTSTLTPSNGAFSTPSSSYSVTAMDTYKTTSSGGTTATFESTTLNTVCKNNTFGMNCSLQCNCNTSNSINKSQTCDPNNGTCLCKEGWTGVNCSQDVNECEINPDICKEMNNAGCYNVYGSFKCQCYIGYVFDGNKTCLEDAPKTTTPMTVNATDSKYKAIITLDLNLHASVDIKVPENYAKVERDVQVALSEFYRTNMDQLFVRVVIVSIRRGSLIVEYFTVTRDLDDALLKLGDANAKLATGETISIAGENSSALRLNVEGNELPTDTSADKILCKSYQSLKGACTAGYECTITDNRPSCTPKKKEDNFVLIVGVGAGTSLVVLLIIVIFVVIFYKRKTKQRKTSKDLIYRSDSISNQTSLHIATKWHTSDLMKQSSHGFYPSDMLGYSLHPFNQKHYPGNEEGSTENNLAGSSCGDEVISSASIKEFKIKRPQVYGVGNVSYDNGIYN